MEDRKKEDQKEQYQLSGCRKILTRVMAYNGGVAAAYSDGAPILWGLLERKGVILNLRRPRPEK